MSNEQLVRDYRITDSELTVFTQHICDSMTRDIAEFAAYGVLAANVTSLQSLCDAFEVFPTDEYINQEYLSAVEARDGIVEELQVIIRSMALRVELKWGKKSPKYKSLDIADLARLSVDSYVTRARMVHAFMTEYQAELTAEGLTELMLDDMEAKIQELDDAIRETIEKNSLRMEKTTERITNGNQLYDLVSRYCEIGKRIWDKVNPAFYNDYIIYSSVSPGSLTAPTGLRFVLSSLLLTWDEVVNATSYNLEASTDGTVFFEIYSGSDTEYNYTPEQEGWMWYRVRARNSAGFGPFSDILQQGYYPGTVLPAPQNLNVQLAAGSPNTIELTWDIVPSATSYAINRSIVAIGAAPGPFSFVTNSHDNEYIENVIPGNRFYFNLTASNSSQWSGTSVNVFIDVV